MKKIMNTKEKFTMNNKKKIFVAALAICLVSIISLGTLAWFQAADSVTNNFYVGDTTTEPDEVFGIDVWETVEGTEIGRGTAEDEGATYEDILPGQILSKAPVLENTGIHPQFVRAIVTVTPANILKDAMGEAWNNADLFLAGTHENWTLDGIVYTNDGTNSKLVYTYYYDYILDAGKTTDVIFDAVVIPTGLTTEMAAQMKDFEIDILGQAIQSEHLADPEAPGAMVTTAKRAFDLFWEDIETYTPSKDVIWSGVELDEPVVIDDAGYYYATLEDATVDGDSAMVLDGTIATAKLVNVTATVDNVVVLNADNTPWIEGGNYTLPAGGKLVVNNTGALTVQALIIGDVYVNGDLITPANVGDYLDTGVTAYFY